MKKTTSFLLVLTLVFSLVFLVACNQEPENMDVPFQDTESNASDSTAPPDDSSENKDESPKEEAQPMKLRVGSYNIANGSKVGHDLEIIAADILSKDLDIVGLQEVDKYAQRSKYIDTLKLLSEYTGYEYYCFVNAVNIPGDEATYGQKGEYGTGILSKYPITATESYKLESGGREQRMLGYAKIDVNGTTVNFFNTHLSYEDDAIREGQLAQICAIVEEYDYCILTGDFNLKSFDEYDALYTLNPTNQADNAIETYVPDDWFKCIDNVLYTDDFTLLDSGAVENNHSDHLMLYAVLEIEE